MFLRRDLFGLKGGRELSIKFMDSLKPAAIVTMYDARTYRVHPPAIRTGKADRRAAIEVGVRPPT